MHFRTPEVKDAELVHCLQCGTVWLKLLNLCLYVRCAVHGLVEEKALWGFIHCTVDIPNRDNSKSGNY